MQKTLTITVDAKVYDGFHTIIGRRRISRFLNDLARTRLVGRDLSAGYAAMAADEAREAEAYVWSDGLPRDVAVNPSAVMVEATPSRGEVWLVVLDRRDRR